MWVIVYVEVLKRDSKVNKEGYYIFLGLLKGKVFEYCEGVNGYGLLKKLKW